MNWLRKIMNGRRGVDELSLTLLVVSVILSIISGFPHMHVLSYIVIVVLFLCYYRVFSKDIAKRYQENQKFLGYVNPKRVKVSNFLKRKKDKTHRYFKCPKCKKLIRVPKGKGKICITCPICKEEFIRKS